MKYIMANFLLVLILGGVIHLQLQNLHHSQEKQQISIKSKDTSKRIPASISKNLDTEILKTMPSKNEYGIINEVESFVGCNKVSNAVKVKGRNVLLVGNACQKIKNLQVTNISNGFTASVFVLDVKKFRTDQIPLVLGVNEIRFDFEQLQRGGVQKVSESISIESL